MDRSPARVIALPNPRGRPSAETPLEPFVKWWLRYATGQIKASSTATYGHGIKAVLASRVNGARLGDMPIGCLDPIDLQMAFGDLLDSGRSPSSVCLAKWALSSALTRAVELGLIESNPARAVHVPTPDIRDKVALSADQVARIVDHLSGRAWTPAGTIAGLLLLTGARISETTAPRAADLALDGPRPTLRIEYQSARSKDRGWHRTTPKTARSRRTVPLVPEAVRLIERRLAVHPRVPTGDDWALGKRLDCPFERGAISMVMRRACQATGAPIITPHGARRTFVTIALERGVPLKTVERLTGDDAVTLVRHYAQGNPDADQAAVLAMFAPVRTGV